MRSHRSSRIGFPSPRASWLGAGAVFLVSGAAHAQVAGTTSRPLPNVLLLVDTSGSMERMPDSSLPSQNREPETGGTITTGPFNVCSPGVQSNPNRWGMLLQALTGNLQPFFSCDAVDRASATFRNEYKINGQAPYDAEYTLPYHRPLTGAGPLEACALGPYKLPGAPGGQGVGPNGLAADSPTDARDFPSDALVAIRNEHLKTQYGSDSPLVVSTANVCAFDQANDGQLDATRDFIRFGLMTFDNDTRPEIGVTMSSPPGGQTTENPFLGQWSYVKSPSNPMLLGSGRPLGCPDDLPFEVGARHWAAPPWEGRMVPFADPFGNIYDLQRTNEQIQQVLLATRPYGATPIDGMMEDARDYLWYNDYGPNGTQPGHADPYVRTGGCRDQYIVLLTDGAPNLDMRPACEGGQCPYPDVASQVAAQLSSATGSRRVRTFVIGFSVNGAGSQQFTNDGFPPEYPAPDKNNCKAWYADVGGNPTSMLSACTTARSAGQAPPGSTADACCKLNEIAYYGSEPRGEVGPFFAETQADLVLSFGRILGGITRSASTRTVPGYSPVVRHSEGSQRVIRTADFIASFIPNAQKVWSGEIDRTRYVCDGSLPRREAQSTGGGDSYAVNTAEQTNGSRFFVSVRGELQNGAVDSGGSIRPYTNATSYSDNVVTRVGTEVAGEPVTLLSTANWPEALDIDDNTCKRSRIASRDGTRQTVDIPRLDKNQCTDVIWKFASAYSGRIEHNGYSGFNVRCDLTSGGGAANPSQGQCSISGGACAVGDSGSCPTPGEVCVPGCSALGAVFRSSPVIAGPPDAFVRDEGYRVFAEQRLKRRPTMYVATADGLLHAFKALPGANDRSNYELWAFVPPAVLPKLAPNYPTGQQILLDGTPAVRDVVWDRRFDQFANPEMWHTTLVAGMGAGGGGYYALNVTDTDCGGAENIDACRGSGRFAPATTLEQAERNGGPHFLWQLTDFEAAASGETAKPTRRRRGDDRQMVALFGKETATPAIATLDLTLDGVRRQVGVAILPGGIDGPPQKDGTLYGACNRALNGGGLGAYSASEFDFSDNTRPFGRRTQVRRWGATCNAPVPGRGVTIVRLDTGEILRHFGRMAQDVPRAIWPVTNDSPFDSPVIGTPVVYPDLVGATTQKVFVGDADGTVWRIDVSSPRPEDWRVSLFQDLVSGDLPGNPGAQQSQPIHIPLVLSLDPAGRVVLNGATGDQENLVARPNEKNYVFSVQELQPDSAGRQGRARVRWFRELNNAERVTGPMTVFDRTLYFATFAPAVPGAAACDNAGTPWLWGMDYFTPGTDMTTGGQPRWCPMGNVDPMSGACTAGLTDRQNPALVIPALEGAIIPGVTIRQTLSCAEFAGDDPMNMTGMTSSKFELYFGATTSRASGGGAGFAPTAERASVARPPPRTPASIDAWAFVID
jgi:type IV pilus assembly protein PilY1